MAAKSFILTLLTDYDLLLISFSRL